MINPDGITVDFYCKTKAEFPKKPPVGFVVGFVRGDKITEYLYTGEGWSAIRARKRTDLDTLSEPEPNQVIIVRNPNGDTRTAPPEVLYTDFQIANRMHISDVEHLMDLVASMMSYAGMNHDYTKITEEKQFFEDFNKARREGADFTKLPWYQLHINSERHHLNNRCPDNVTLIDVIEMICDCCAAGAARSGKISDVHISDEVLQKAVKNTVTLIANSILIQ